MECLLYWFLSYETNIYVTDVIVTWSDVIDQLYYCFWPGVKPIRFVLVLMLLTNWVSGGHLADVIGYVY